VGGTWERVARSIGTKLDSAFLGSAFGPIALGMGLDVVVPQSGLSIDMVCIGGTRGRVKGTKLLCEVDTESKGRGAECISPLDGGRGM
jgi:hypothetical protein